MRTLIILLAVFAFQQITAQFTTIWYSDFSSPNDWYINTTDEHTTDFEIGYGENYYMGAFKSYSSANGYAIVNTDAKAGYTFTYIWSNSSFPVNVNQGEIRLNFEHFFKNWEGSGESTSLSIKSLNSGEWADILLNEGFERNDTTANPEIVDIDIKQYLNPDINGDDEIEIAFVYKSETGDNYAWYIDDVWLYYYQSLLGKDAAVKNIHAYGKLPLSYGAPHAIKAKIKNEGGVAFANLPVSLNISGANTFADIQIINSLPAGDSAIVEFSGFIPVSLGLNNVSVSLPDDDNLENNVLNYQQEVTYNTFSLADTSAPFNSLGIKQGSGMTLSKFYISEAKSVVAIDVHLYDTKSIGKTVYAVVLDKDNKEIGRSENYIIKTADLDSLRHFVIANPPLLKNTWFYAGLAQYEQSDAYWPVAAQKNWEAPLDGSYFAVDLVPTNIYKSSLSLRPMISAILGDPTPSICLVTQDMETGKNQIVWERYPSGSINKYEILREGNVANVFEKIGESPYDSIGVFTDLTGANQKRQYAYKIQAIDTMGNKSPASPYHKTLLLQLSGGVTAGVINLDWENYAVEGKEIQFDSYLIYKSAGLDSVNLIAVDTIPGNQKKYVDEDIWALRRLTFYRIAGVLRDTCSPDIISAVKTGKIYNTQLKAGGGVYVQSVSNMEDNRLRFTSNVEFIDANPYNIILYPNPVSNQSVLRYKLNRDETISVSLYDITGKAIGLLYNGKQMAGQHSLPIGSQIVANLAPGMYIIKFKTDKELFIKQLVK